MRSNKGFTVAELITVCAIIAVLAAIAMPVARFGIRRQRELELRARLRRITDAIDRYHDLRMAPPPNNIKSPPSLGQGNWPKDLEELVKGVELSNGKKIKFLRQRDLVDPMTGKKEWLELGDTNEPDATDGNGINVFDVHSKSHALALDGKTHYNEW